MLILIYYLYAWQRKKFFLQQEKYEEEQKKLQDCGEFNKVVGIIDETLNQNTVVSFQSDITAASTTVIDISTARLAVRATIDVDNNSGAGIDCGCVNSGIDCSGGAGECSG
jgi:hypothetical protein